MTGNLDKSATTALRLTFQGRSWDISSAKEKYTVKYVGTYELCLRGLDEYKVGSVGEHGTVENVRISQANEAFWYLEVIYEIEEGSYSYSSRNGDDEKTASGTSKQPTKSELTSRTMSLPIEVNSNYRMIWNNNLYTTTGSTVLPVWWNTAGRDFIPPEGYFYAKTWGEVPSIYGKPIMLARMFKPGVESWSYPTYSLTESSRHNKKDDAAWTVAKRVGCITKPIKGDFDIVDKFGGNWLCEGGSVRWDGKKWLAQREYTWGGPTGWDTTIYPVVD